MIRNFILSVALCICYCTVFAQKHTDVQIPSSTTNDVHLLSYKQAIAAPYPYNLQKKGTIQQQSSSGTYFSGSIKQHRLHGKWQSRYANGQLIDEGTLIKGIPHGEWKVWSHTGTLLAIRNYDADLLQRVQQELQLNHPRNYFYTITDVYKKKGVKALTYLTANYSFNISSPAQESTIANIVNHNASNIAGYRPVFTNCLHHGLFMNFYNNGQVKDSGYYHHGLKEGIWLHSVNSGAGVWKGSYQHGMHEREWKLYNASGKLILIIFYNQYGKEVWRKEL
jgi:antitoxin component YwqK of YwqJK toxin-antitoxin module